MGQSDWPEDIEDQFQPSPTLLAEIVSSRALGTIDAIAGLVEFRVP